MENNQINQEPATDQTYQYAANLLINEKKTPGEVRDALQAQGIDAANSIIIVESLQDEIKKAKQKSANNDMLYGALWCVGGTIATVANVGFIFWGAIIFGGVQFFKGLISYNNID